MMTPYNQILTYSEALQSVGSRHKYQYLMLFNFLIQWMVTVYSIMSSLFFIPDPEFICENNNSCTESQACNSHQALQFKQNDYETMTSDLKLYCEHKHYRALSQSLLFVGSVFGSVLSAYLADQKGRSIVQMVMWAFGTSGCIMITFTQNRDIFIVGMFIAGFGLVPCNNLNLILINEQCDDKVRQIFSTILLMSWGLFECILVPTVYYITSWRTVYLWFIALPATVTAMINLLIRESPKFLLTQSNKKALKILNYIAQINSKPQLPNSTILKESLQIQKQVYYNYYHLFKIPHLRPITLGLCSTMFSVQLSYYSTFYSLSKIGLNTYLNALFLASFECVAISLIFLIPDLGSAIETILACTLKVLNCVLLGVLAIYCEELYPTQIRSSGIGMYMGIGILGAALAPYLIEIANELNVKAIGAVGIVTFPGIFAIFYLKETLNQGLQDYVIEDQANSCHTDNNSYIQMKDEVK